MLHLSNPKHKLTLAGNVYECEILKTAQVVRNENGFDAATITIDNEGWTYPDVISAGSTVQLEVTNEGESYPTNPMFKGILRFPIATIEKNRLVVLKCLGSGYGLGQMQVADEYGVESVNVDYDTITEAFTDIITNYVNKYLKGAGSGFTYNMDNIEVLADTFRYMPFPYKYAYKCFNDLIDLYSALKAGAASAHWIVTTDDHVRLKLITGTQAGWTKYYGNSQANATLTYEEDYELLNLEELGAEANSVIYYGAWRRPSNGDYWTNQSKTLWDHDATIEVDDYTPSPVKVGTYSLGANRVNGNGNFWYPLGKDAVWDFNGFTDFNTPNLNFWMLRDGALGGLEVDLHEDANEFFYYYPLPVLTNANEWYHFSIPIGPCCDLGAQDAGKLRWSQILTPQWNNINYILFGIDFTGGAGTKLYIDGLHFGGAAVLREAYNSDITPYSMKLIVDDVGKDDSLKDGDDSGLMAQMAYSELLRLQKTTYLTTVKCDMLPEALPGQWFNIQSNDNRVTQVIHNISGDDYTTTLNLTDDLTNGRSRTRYEDLNRQYADLRPEFQDRQATNIKAGTVDWRITRLKCDYAP